MAIEVRIQKHLDAFELDIDFQSESRRIGILGASGCGKSMVLKCIAGIETPDAGRIAKGGKVFFDAKEKTDVKPQKRRVGYLFQNYALFPAMTVEENIAAGLRGTGEEKRQRVKEMIETFHLTGLEKRLPGKLSGGQQQRVALARIMAYEPDMILLDEPFSALDVYLRDEMQREMLALLEDYEGTVILVSHSRDEIYRMSEEVLIMESGKIIQNGPTKAVFEQPVYTAAARLTGCKNIVGIEKKAEGLWVEDWNMFLPINSDEKDSRGVPDNGEEPEMAAIRAHQFRLLKTEENMISFPVIQPVVTEDLFEYHISFLTSEKAKQRINWKISKDLWKYGKDKLPEMLYLKREDLHLLKKG